MKIPPTSLLPSEEMATTQNAESEALALVVYQTSGIEVKPLVLQTRFQVLWKRGYGMRSRDAEFKRKIESEEGKASWGNRARSGYAGQILVSGLIR